MGDNIRLKGPLGLKQDIYDDKRAKEFKKIIQLPTKEFIAEYLAKIDAETKKEVDGGLIEPKEYEAKRKQQQKTIPQVQTLKGLKEKIKTYSEFKKSKKRFEEENKQHDLERDKLQEQEDYKRFLDQKYGVEVKKGGAIKVKKAVFGSLIRNMLHGKKTTTEDSAAPYRQTFNVKDSETGEIKNIMQDFKPIQSQNNLSNDTGLIGRLFGAVRNKPTGDVGPLKHDFYVKDKSGQNVNIVEKKSGGLIRQGYPKIAKKGWK